MSSPAMGGFTGFGDGEIGFNNVQSEPKPKQQGSYMKPSPSPGVFTECIEGAVQFPKAKTPMVMNISAQGVGNWQIIPDNLEKTLTDGNTERTLTSNCRTGGQVITKHDFATGRRSTFNYFGIVTSTVFENTKTKKHVHTPGVNLNVNVNENSPVGEGSLEVSANQGSIAKVIGETALDPTPANKFRVETAFLPPLEALPGLLCLGVARTHFPAFVMRYRLWDTKAQPLADISLAFEPTVLNPLALALPMQVTPLFYEIKPNELPKKISVGEAVELKKKHKAVGSGSDPVNGVLSRMKQEIKEKQFEKFSNV